MRVAQFILAILLCLTFHIAQADESRNIAEILRSNSNYSTLVNQLTQADLINTLEGQGKNTLFAPTNAAFAKLPPQVLEDLGKPENKNKLIAILKYHIIPKPLETGDMTTTSYKTLNGRDIDIRIQGAEVIINGNARIVRPDVEASNGVIQVVDTVLIPKN